MFSFDCPEYFRTAYSVLEPSSREISLSLWTLTFGVTPFHPVQAV